MKILKPNEAFAPPIRVPVAELFFADVLQRPARDGGHRDDAHALGVTPTESQLRARRLGGTLLLDNPLGNANAGFLIEVQRTVAAAAGIQLIYTTGIADLNALRRFTSVIALSNDAARRTMRRYVRANPALLELLVPPEDGAGAAFPRGAWWWSTAMKPAAFGTHRSLAGSLWHLPMPNRGAHGSGSRRTLPPSSSPSRHWPRHRIGAHDWPPRSRSYSKPVSSESPVPSIAPSGRRCRASSSRWIA